VKTLGERLLVARKAARLSQRDLGERVGVSATAISKYERDLDVPSSGVLLRLARATDRRVDFFLRSRDIRVSCVDYRKRASLGEKDKAAILAKVRDGAERYLEALDLFGSGDQSIAVATLPVISIASVDEAENAAEKVREAWKLGLGPIERMVDVLEDNGVLVLTVAASARFDGFTCLVDDILPVVAVRAGIPGDRQRMSLAHELGHLVLRFAPGVDAEKAAYRFGASFLVPRDAVIRELGRSRSAFEVPEELALLKQKYGISMQAWIYRAQDLKVIRPETAAAYYRLFRARGWYRDEPGAPVATEEPKKLRQLVFRALAEGLLTESRAGELLGEPIRRSSGSKDVAAA
jgi:Zn-dependent peptidase ImmA (M78 family)/DNA-binding XRE family transcriptional regulator